MAKPTSEADTIESLLEQRAQFEQWLAKLDSAANKAPASVRHKVRGDYEARLRGVIERLRGHAATIAGELERHQGSQAELDRQRRDAEEELAEAEVRHAVGEYTEDEWARISQQSEGTARRPPGAAEVGGQRDRAAGGGPVAHRRPGPPAGAAPGAGSSAEPEPMIERNPPPPPPPRARAGARAAGRRRTATKPAPRAGAGAARPRTSSAFLKSVADDDLKPAPRRPEQPRVAQPAPAPRAVERPAARAGTAATAPAPAGGKTGAPGVAKTLKCGECGTLNRPTEWYCERCGAELAGSEGRDNAQGVRSGDRTPSYIARTVGDYFLPLTSLARRLFCRAAALGWMIRLRPARSSRVTASA